MHFEFYRYRGGVRKAEGVKINRADTLEDAIQQAVKLADPGDVLVLGTGQPPGARPFAYQVNRRSDGKDFGLFHADEAEDEINQAQYDLQPLYLRPAAAPPLPDEYAMHLNRGYVVTPKTPTKCVHGVQLTPPGHEDYKPCAPCFAFANSVRATATKRNDP